jgi:hypothetical protein
MLIADGAFEASLKIDTRISFGMGSFKKARVLLLSRKPSVNSIISPVKIGRISVFCE